MERRVGVRVRALKRPQMRRIAYDTASAFNRGGWRNQVLTIEIVSPAELSKHQRNSSQQCRPRVNSSPTYPDA